MYMMGVEVTKKHVEVEWEYVLMFKPGYVMDLDGVERLLLEEKDGSRWPCSMGN